jgi:hypothetical protein
VNAAKTFLRGDEKPAQTDEDHAGRLCGSHRAVREMKAAGKLSQAVQVRSSQYLNNLIEQKSPASETVDSADVVVQTIRQRGDHY